MEMRPLNDKERAGMNKKSFELNYEGGTIWCEHLDSMGNLEVEVIKKFEEDFKVFSRPSVSAHVIINLDETIVSGQIADCIVNSIIGGTKRFRKIAFIGIDKKRQKQFEKIAKEAGAIVAYWKDYEKAKEWVLKH